MLCFKVGSIVVPGAWTAGGRTCHLGGTDLSEQGWTSGMWRRRREFATKVPGAEGSPRRKQLERLHALRSRSLLPVRCEPGKAAASQVTGPSAGHPRERHRITWIKVRRDLNQAAMGSLWVPPEDSPPRARAGARRTHRRLTEWSRQSVMEAQARVTAVGMESGGWLLNTLSKSTQKEFSKPRVGTA